MSYIKPKFLSYTLPLSENIILRPEHTRAITPNGTGFFLGALCYRYSKNVGKNCYIVPDSLIPARIAWVRKLIYLFSDFIEHDPRRDISIAAIFRSFAQYIRWCDSEGLNDVLTGNKTKDYEAYSLYLSEKVKTHQLKSAGAQVTQSQIKEIYLEIFEDPQFYEGVPNIPKRNDSEPTEPPCEDRQSKTLSLCMSIFQGMSDFILNGHPYPFFIKTPEYLKFKDNGFWISHSGHWFDLSHLYTGLPVYNGPIDYISGKTRTAQELSELTGDSLNLCKRRIYKHEFYRLKANIDTRCSSRLDKARLAMSAFYILFIANTGINNAQAKSLQWDVEYTEERNDKVGFKTIKYRASGKITYFEIQSRFIKHFKKYLKLREYVNNDSSVNLLFGYQSKNRVTTPNIKSLVNTVNKLDPMLDFVMPMEWRAAKSDWYIRNHDPSLAALALQNTERTILKNYAAGSHAKHAIELSLFFDTISNLGINIEDDSNNHTVSSVGHCIDPLHPKALIKVKAIESDCKQPEGCLFCDKFVIHSDDQDIRKLFSCLFCIDQTAHLSASIDDYEDIFGPVRKRIGMIIDKVSSLSNKHENMVNRIRSEVIDKEELDPYWESKLSMLIEIGVI
ncbi:hypothetical protein [Acinetobacter venetianus]|uniref:Integrase n=1 Tax=Acinetobacter venetianus TaxID=52133 RepID=A0A150HTU9_9GAMM|nr:hypothetical protein [Acinetobacter venetianus]KXZ70272.1 hypothetical protein AVENLUH13518_01896 [Acinetobacter venetianus]